MEYIKTMFKPRPSQSPVRSSPVKRHLDELHERPFKCPKTEHRQDQTGSTDEPKFTFDQVKQMLELMLSAKDKSKKLLVNAGMRSFDYNQIAIPGHSVDQCKELLERLIKNTRRVRTLNEVLTEIKDNLERKSYTEIIQRATLDGEVPKRPASAYLLYHRDRFPELKQEYSLAAEVSKIVAEEWKTLSERKRREYQRKHNDLMRKYEEEMRRLGLVDDQEPKRPHTARTMYIQDRLESLDDDYDRQDLSKLKEQFGNEFDSLDKDTKKFWDDLYKEKREQYKQEREEFTASHPHLKPKSANNLRTNKANSNGSSKIKKADMPLPPRSALRLYIEKNMPDGVEGEEAKDLEKRLKEKFSQFSSKKLLKFVKKAIKDKARYDEEVKEFLEKHPDCDELRNKEVKANLTKDQWKLFYSVVENKPSLPSPNTYLYYCSKLLSDETYSSGIEPTQRMQFASQSWRALSDEERANIEQEHMDSIENYIEEMNAWLEQVGPERRRQILIEEPRANPDYWRKKIKKSQKAAAKQSSSAHYNDE